MKFGIVECGVLKKVRNEYSVAEGSSAMAGKVGALGSLDDMPARVP